MSFYFDLRKIKTKEGLAGALGLSERALEAIVSFQPSLEPEPSKDGGIHLAKVPLFCRHVIPKKNKARGSRIVWEPILVKSEYKAIARRLDSFFKLALRGYPHDCAHGYRPGRNIKENAAPHAGHVKLMSVDIKDFFQTIDKNMLSNLLISLEIDSSISELMSKVLTISGRLPMGFPTSPVISNAILIPLDVRLLDIAENYGCAYSRYADDMSFSSDGDLPAFGLVKSIVAEIGFTLDESKTRISKLGQCHYVTGLSVSDVNGPHVPRERKRKLRQELYYSLKYGFWDHCFHRGIDEPRRVQREINRIDGMVKFIAHHEPNISDKIRNAWSKIQKRDGIKASFIPRGRFQAPFVMLIDEAEFQHTALAMCICATQHYNDIIYEAGQVLEDATSDLWAAGDQNALLKKGLHYADASEDLRLEFVKKLARMPFDGYVAYELGLNARNYQKVYLNLIGALVARRLMTAEGQFCLFVIEGNPKVSEAEIRNKIDTTYNDLRKRGSRCPEGIGIKFVSKPDLGISIPDFLLGVLGRYLSSGVPSRSKSEPRDRLMFERIRDKYRVIINLSERVEYSRRRPILPWDTPASASSTTGRTPPPGSGSGR